jgi:hypothetical protein
MVALKLPALFVTATQPLMSFAVPDGIGLSFMSKQTW